MPVRVLTPTYDESGRMIKFKVAPEREFPTPSADACRHIIDSQISLGLPCSPFQTFLFLLDLSRFTPLCHYHYRVLVWLVW